VQDLLEAQMLNETVHFSPWQRGGPGFQNYEGRMTPGNSS